MSVSTVRSGTRPRTVVALAAVAAVGAAAGIALWPAGSTATPRTVEGWAMPNADGTAISLHDGPEGGPGEGYIVAGAWWEGVDGVQHDGAVLPTCVGADTSSLTHVELDLVTVEMADGSSWHHVVALRCLE